ncbi:hypothetical protein K438DRAFT_1953652 [Mycena galopus ATCC 62051]|nr:hypothetical protein K438DRAFT_1953652 [Mycena galopus ATCC 62051]
MSTPPAKRKRTEDAPSITRSETWRSDGNVVLQAGTTQFRVHWSVLALHSSVFRDMQGLPQPTDQPTIDGCPIVELSDNPDDVEYLLKALYIPIFYRPKTVRFTLPSVGAVIRLGRKYDFKNLLDSAVACLESEYRATTLEEYDALPENYETIQSYAGVTFDAIALASSNNILSVLPCVYYFAVQCFSLAQLFHGIRKRDGTLASLLSIDLGRCVLARERLLISQFQPGNTLGWARKWDFNDCTTLERCRIARDHVLSEYLDSALIGALVKPSDLGLSKFCATCIRHIHECITSGRKKLWEGLPQIFDLPPWSELKNDI